ncbi:MAG: hypothetical protein II879_02545 [Clostridia bacterium]|nr:hypothetical protein [Clostridia bacterium]
MAINGAAFAGEDSAPMPVLTAKTAGEFFEQGSKVRANEVCVVNLSGTWYEMGRQYGALMKAELAEVYDFVETIIEYSITALATRNRRTASSRSRRHRRLSGSASFSEARLKPPV